MTTETTDQPTIKKPVIHLKTRLHYYDSSIGPACPIAEALFALLGQKRLTARELPLIGKMGFEVKIVGETTALSNEMYKLGKLKDTERVLANREMTYIDHNVNLLD